MSRHFRGSQFPVCKAMMVTITWGSCLRTSFTAKEPPRGSRGGSGLLPGTLSLLVLPPQDQDVNPALSEPCQAHICSGSTALSRFCSLFPPCLSAPGPLIIPWGARAQLALWRPPHTSWECIGRLGTMSEKKPKKFLKGTVMMGFAN